MYISAMLKSKHKIHINREEEEFNSYAITNETIYINIKSKIEYSILNALIQLLKVLNDVFIFFSFHLNNIIQIH